eukprot:7278910-Prymnesium_polylepis.2
MDAERRGRVLTHKAGVARADGLDDPDVDGIGQPPALDTPVVQADIDRPSDERRPPGLDAR